MSQITVKFETYTDTFKFYLARCSGMRLETFKAAVKLGLFYIFEYPSLNILVNSSQ